MKKIFAAFIAFSFLLSCDLSRYKLDEAYDFETVFEKSGGTETATYPEVISFYQNLADVFPSVELTRQGTTDSGEPLHLAVYNPAGNFNIEELRKDHLIILVNNGIHPGESDGIDATMMLFRDLAQDSVVFPENTILVTIPVYNIGGALNRNSTTRTNQEGPEAYGFRGNARNFDLNRDFIKADTKNSRSFAEIFHLVNPDVFIDNHVSNGADYQYTLTHLFTQHNKLGGELGEYLHNRMMPGLQASLKDKNREITPYVNVFNEVPEKGFSQFMDYPRYSTGYAALWSSLGLMVETHMLKPYKQRVYATYDLMISMIEIAAGDREVIKDLRSKARRKYMTERWYPLNFQIDSSKVSKLQFKGYEAEIIESPVTGGDRLRYKREEPFTKEIDYYDHFSASEKIEIPRAYVIPQGWWEVIQLLTINKVEMKPLKRDTTMTVEVYRIENYNTRKTPFEGHYPHSNTRVSSSRDSVNFRRGDMLISTFQPAVRYLLETLEPAATDSFFNWNFFDSVLQQKEGFSPYVFEDLAEELLEANPQLKADFEQKKKEDPAFANSWYSQLDWIHKRSPYYEEAHLRYPVFRISR